MLQFRFVFAAFFVTAILIFVVYLRDSEKRAFYELCKIKTQQNRLKQELANKHLQLENIINPARLSENMIGQGKNKK